MNARSVCATFAALCIAAALFVLRPPAAATGAPFRDFQAYHAAGVTNLEHRDPYSRAVAQREPLRNGAMLPFVGTPASLPFWTLLARAPAAASAYVWQALLILAFATLVFASALLANIRRPFDLICLTLAGLSFAPLTSSIALAQSALVAAAAAAFALALRTRVALMAGSFVAFVFQPNVALGVLAALRRGWGALALSAAAVYLCGAIERGFAWPFSYLQLLAAHGAAEGLSALQFTPAAVAHGFGAYPVVATGLATLLAAAAAIVAIFVAWRARDERVGYAAISAALPFSAGFFHGHDFAALFAPAMLLLLAPRNVRAFARWSVFLIGVNWLDFSQLPPDAPEDLALGCGLMFALLALSPKWDAAVYAFAGCAVALLALAAWTGVTHPLPIWPDTMGAFTPPHHASAAAIWRAELAQTGLLNVHPASALLRCFPLIGSAMLLLVAMQRERCDSLRIEEAKPAVYG